MMQRFKNFRLATQGITAVLLFGIAFAAGAAEQMMRVQPAPAAAQSTVVAPAGLLPALKPPSPNATMSPKNLSPTTPGGGVMQLSPAAACGMNPTPRIGNINGRQSGIDFKPGDSLNIAGCGFGKGGTVVLVDGLMRERVTLIIDKWEDANILAHINSGLSGVPDVGVVNVHVKPNGAPAITSLVKESFTAARENFNLALPKSSYHVFGVTFSQAWGTPNVVEDFVATIVRHTSSCPLTPNQQTQMVDTWHIDSPDEAFDRGYVPVGAKYENLAKHGNNIELVGNQGSASFVKETRTITVVFQGAKESPLKCTSQYAVSLIVSGPRGILPKPITNPNPS